jgi:hypothetical protein
LISVVAGPRSEPAADGSSNSRLHVLVASPLSNVCCRELCETAGENVTVTKHGFGSRLRLAGTPRSVVFSVPGGRLSVSPADDECRSIARTVAPGSYEDHLRSPRRDALGKRLLPFCYRTTPKHAERPGRIYEHPTRCKWPRLRAFLKRSEGSQHNCSRSHNPKVAGSNPAPPI